MRKEKRKTKTKFEL